MKLDDGNYGSPRWTYEILDCAMPMTFDTYSNCAHQCLYCFSFFQRAVGAGADDYLHHKVRSVNVERVKRMFTDPDKHGGQFKNYIKRRMTLQWGGLSDGFDWYEKKFGKSLELLRFFREIDYPISISTKGVWWVYDERYREVVKDAKNMHFKYSIITSIEEHVPKLEPGTPPAKERFNAMRELNNLGVGATTLRFRPFVIGTSDKCIEEMMTMGEDSGCISVTTEFLAWESRASVTSRERLEMMSKVLGYDVWEFYRKNSARASGLLRLNYDLKRPYIHQMKESAERHNMRFFVSDAHHKEESYHAGCCGLPESGPLSNVNRGQYAHAIKIAKDKGLVKWSDIKDEAYELLKDIPVISAEGFPSDTAERMKRHYQNMYDYMHDIWNNPISWQSPARYFGGALVAAQPDENGDIVYLYNKPFIEDGLRVDSVNELAIQLRMVGKPNAERFDEMVADGTDFGHVAYPVVVLSRKRSNTATTMALLDASRINYVIAVSKEDLNDYENAFPNADIIIVDKPNSIRLARQSVYAYYAEQGYPYVWMLDDDISSISIDGKPVNIRRALSEAEAFVNDYSNVAMLGFGAINAKFLVNQTVNGISLVNLSTGMDFNTKKMKEIELFENEAFALQHVETGKWVTVSYGKYVVATNIGFSGGVNKILIEELETKKSIRNLQQMYPGIVEETSSGILVQWKHFSSPIRSVHVEALMKGE